MVKRIQGLGVAAWLAWAALAWAADQGAPPPPPPDASPGTGTRLPRDVQGHCLDCGVVRRIRSVERERPAPRNDVPSYMTSEQYHDTRRYSEPVVGPVFGMTFGPGQETRTFVGAAGSSTMRNRMLEIVYDVSVRFDDGRYAVVQLADASGFRVGDRVRVIENRLELLPADLK
jgi:hypothetical protein